MAIRESAMSPEMIELNRFDNEVDKLKVVFEQYFVGVEKKPPTDRMEALQKELRQKILGVRSTNTAYKFKRQTVEQKFVTLKNYWDRVLKEIEEGTYVRVRKRAELHERQKAAAAEEMARRRVINEAVKAGKPVSEALKEFEAGRGMGQPPAGSAPAGAKTGAQAQRPAAARPAASPIDQLHEVYMSARQKTGEGAVDRAAFQAMIQKQIPAIKEKFNCRTVEFKVVVENGKTKLKAIPKN